MTTRFKTTRLFLLLLLPLTFLQAAKAQILVTDGGAIANQAIQIKHMVEQFQQMQEQYRQMQSTHNSMNGLRGISSLLSNDLLTQSLPFNAQQYNSIINGFGGNATVTAAIKKIISQNQTTNCSVAHAGNNIRQQACEKQWKVIALQQLASQNILNQSAVRMNNLSSMLDTISKSPDAKSIADYEARLELEQIKTSTERVQLEMIKSAAEAEQRMVAQKFSDGVISGAALELR